MDDAATVDQDENDDEVVATPLTPGEAKLLDDVVVIIADKLSTEETVSIRDVRVINGVRYLLNVDIEIEFDTDEDIE